MQPHDLRAEQFAAYPSQARTLVVAHLQILQQLPLSFVPSLLREVIEYDYKFPAERSSIDRELDDLNKLSPAQRDEWFHGFSQFSISSKLEQMDWVNQPAQFIEQLSAYLWTTHQLDAFRETATTYGNRLQGLSVPKPLPLNRLGVAILGQRVSTYDGPLFRNLRKHGVYFGQVDPENGLALLLAAVAKRAQTCPVPYGHWYVDGGTAEKYDPLLTNISYQALEPVRAALLSNIQKEVARPGMGPEELRTHLARLTPADLGLGRSLSSHNDPILDRLQLKLLTEGSGTQIFSTTFTQWTSREVLRRAEPLTLLARYAPRQRQRPMNELLSGTRPSAELDPIGSLIDGDMAAYYQWINQQRLSGSQQSAFVVWFEGHRQAMAIGPSLPRGTESTSKVDLGQLVSLVTS